MKYLLIRKPRVGATPPTAQVVRAQKEFVLALVKKGVLDCAYAFVGGGGCSIINADSPEKLNEQLWGGPMALFYEYEVRPLADYDRFMEEVAGAMERQGR
jgi:hypothetical protein